MGTVDPKIQAEFDQGAKTLGDNIPPLMWALHSGFVNQGFQEADALELCKTYLRAVLENSRNA